MSPAVKALAQELLELEAARPEMPRGLTPEDPRFIAWHQDFQKHVDSKVELLKKINGHLYPIDTTTIQERPMAACRPRTPRLRQ